MSLIVIAFKAEIDNLRKYPWTYEKWSSTISKFSHSLNSFNKKTDMK